MTQHELVVTRDGAPAVLDRDVGEVMHPGMGPLAEAECLYITPSALRARLSAADAAPDALVLLDAGLGAGTNAIAAWHAAQSLAEPCRPLEILSIDRTVGALELALQPPHAAAFGFEHEAELAARTLLDARFAQSPRIRWRLRVGDMLSELAHEPPASLDIVFWDLFSPRSDPSLWSVAAFTLLRRLCRPDATVHTYSGATTTRTALLLAGFAVGYAPPSGAKQKHSTVAVLDHRALAAPLDRRWLENTQRQSAGWPSDAPSDAAAIVGLMPQFAAQ